MQKKTGIEPRALQDRPAPIPELQLYRTAYRRLSQGRQWGESGPQAIACSEVFAYCDGLGMHGPGFREQFLDHIQEMDAAYLEGIRKKQAAATPASTAKSDVVPAKLGGDNA